MVFLPSYLTAAYFADLLLGDPVRWLHPVRWIGHLISWMERIFYDGEAPPALQRLAGFVFWVLVIVVVMSGTLVVMGLSGFLHPILGHIVVIWLGYTTLATRSLHQESQKVVRALRAGDIQLARERLGWIVSRDTQDLDEKGILRALLETVSENISDGIVAPLLYLAIGGPLWAMMYKAANTMDSMVGYLSERHRHFGWFAAKADDVANWIPARLSALILVGAAACLKLDWREAWRIVRRDARKMKSPNAGFPEAASAGALNVQIGGANVYFGVSVEKPTLGDPQTPLSLETYSSMIRLMYMASFLTFILALGARTLILAL